MADRNEGPRGWIITLVCFFTGLIELGTFKSFGLFILPIRESLKCSIAEIGTAMAASHTVCYVLVPLVNILTEKYGPRRLIIGGGAIMLLSFLAISLAQNIVQFAILIVVWGIGVSMVYMPPFFSLLFHYRGRLALPVGISSTGCAVGMMVYPPLTESLIEIYGWRGTMIILAAVNANVCVFGALFKPSSADYVAVSTDVSEWKQTSHIGMTKREILRKRCKDVCMGLFKLLSLDVLWEEPPFTLYAFAMFLYGIMYSGWMIYLVPHALARDIGSQQAAFLSTAGGVGTLVGRIIYGPILYQKYITPVQMCILLALANCGAFMLDPTVAGNYTGLAILAIVNGLSLGTIASLFSQVSEQVLYTVSCDRALGTLCVFFAGGELAGGAFAGLVYNLSGSYDVTFMMLGVLSALVAIVSVIERALDLCNQS